MSYKLDLQLWKDFVIVKCSCKNTSNNFSHVCRNPIPIFRLIWAHPMMQHWDISSERHFSSGYLNLSWPGNRTNTHILHFLNFPFQLSYRTKYYFSSWRPQKSLKTFMPVVRLYHHRSEMNEQERATVEWLYQTRLTSIWRKRAISAQLGLAPTPKSHTWETAVHKWIFATWVFWLDGNSAGITLLSLQVCDTSMMLLCISSFW